ncbi:MAG: mechanosensitive ion channel family protein [Methylophilaceae bacterium]
MDLEMIMNKAVELALVYGPKLVAAIVVLIIGLWVIKGVTRGVRTAMDTKNIDPSLKPFVVSIVNVLLKVMLVISVLGMLGIQMTSFIAVLGAAGLAIGLALSGTLQNFAGGVMILLLKPFKVGDFIDTQDYLGKVSAIKVFNTVLLTPDNKTIIIPNGELSNKAITNFSTQEQRRVDWTIGVGYGDDVDKARQVIQKLIDQESRILKDPAVLIAVSELADSSVNFAVRAWVMAGDYWPVYYEMNENVYKTFAKEGLNIPFPQMDVHLHK